MSPTPEMTNVFQFMELRAPYTPEAKALRQNYIRDDFVGFRDDKPARVDSDLQSDKSSSAIGKLVYEHAICNTHDYLLEDALDFLTPYAPPCPGDDPDRVKAKPISIFELEGQAHISQNDAGIVYYLLPERLENIEGLKLFPELLRAFEVMEGARRNFSLPNLIKDLEAVFGRRILREVVFHHGVYADDFRAAKRSLYDTLYLLYIMRPRTSVNLEHVIEGLRVLHVIEALAVDGLIRTLMIKPLSPWDRLWSGVLKALAMLGLIKPVKPGSLSPSDSLLKKTLEVLYPELQGWNGYNPLPTLPLIQSKTDFDAYLKATPVVHPIFARLRNYRFPFNDLKPIGIGDLKVVKQWLVAYLPGEISHIENVLKGEIKDRTHRRLEKTEESFSFSSSRKEETQNDTQTTERYELKREVENIIKTDLNVGANANVMYDYKGGNYTVVANVGANFSYKRDVTDQSKLSEGFSREILAKAMERVEKNTAESRSVTKLFETEETNKHGFDNRQGTGHVTGIYRWLDKKYKAQLFNYGKRMMFEFVIPEPAAFFVESRLRAFESTLEIPQPPKVPQLKSVTLNFTATAIDSTMFQRYRQIYDLAEFKFPEENKNVDFIDLATGDNLFKQRDIGGSIWFAKTYTCKLNAKDYILDKLIVTGYMDFFDRGEAAAQEQNTLEISVNGQRIVRVENENIDNHWVWNPGNEYNVAPGLPLGDDIPVTIGSLDLNHYYLSLRGKLKLSNQAKLEWQTQVFNKIRAIEQQKVDKENQEALLQYNTQLATYRNRVAELKATTVNVLLQGQSEAFNREIIRTELKKHCLTMLTKEFDSDDSDDILGKIDAVQGRSDNFNFPKFQVEEEDGKLTTASFESGELEDVIYPAIVIDDARKKGRFIQFLEQAFEWQQLAYIFYPYFWAQQPDWIAMMSRSDDADPNMTAFLQAGSVKVLLAVTPAYDDAVLHFLATREPWEGGPAPVIGDPLFIPLHEEMRKRQDDLYNAVPEGDPWTFVLPTSLVYLDDSGAPLPTFPDITG